MELFVKVAKIIVDGWYLLSKRRLSFTILPMTRINRSSAHAGTEWKERSRTRVRTLRYTEFFTNTSTSEYQRNSAGLSREMASRTATGFRSLEAPNSSASRAYRGREIVRAVEIIILKWRTLIQTGVFAQEDRAGHLLGIVLFVARYGLERRGVFMSKQYSGVNLSLRLSTKLSKYQQILCVRNIVCGDLNPFSLSIFQKVFKTMFILQSHLAHSTHHFINKLQIPIARNMKMISNRLFFVIGRAILRSIQNTPVSEHSNAGAGQVKMHITN
ncbi:Hypothetical_protein [Hexamita inflata]|uniref:Hypothetical_protein n=1 Tax=Hexamita inflata TaxID=28002 RepID=A0ABP1JS65_9EUKA